MFIKFDIINLESIKTTSYNAGDIIKILITYNNFPFYIVSVIIFTM